MQLEGNQKGNATNIFSEKVVLITGGRTEISKAAAMQFAGVGARVLLSDPDLIAAEAVTRAIEQAGGEARVIATKVGTRAETKAMVNEALEAFGCLHYAVNNVMAEVDYGLIHEIEEKGWDDVIDFTLKSVWLAMKYEIPAIKDSGGGAIVNVASAASLSASPGLSAFGAARAGVISLSKSAAAEVAKDNVRINSISPGSVMTDALQRLCESEPALKELMESAQVMGRMAKPEEVASCIRFLCSDDSSFITGDNLVVDGGGMLSRI